MPRIFLETFGCQMNVLDSELVLGQLHARGYTSTDDRDQADVIIYNTCSVREHAEQKVWSRLGELRERKEQEPGLVLGVIGCMAEREGTEMFKRHPHVDILCGPAELDKLPVMVENALATSAVKMTGALQLTSATDSFARPGTVDFDDGATSVATLPRRARAVALMGKSVRRSSTLEAAGDQLEMLDLSRVVSASDDVSQAYVRITRGCNKFCTYCVVPYTRGPEVHRPPGNIIEEVRKLVDAGAQEVTLLGQTINHYCFTHPDGRQTSFADLLYQVHEATPDLPRLRFVTSFPRDFTDEALQAMRDCRRICRYLHAPAQHGSDRVLKMMNRGYTTGQYKDFADRARQIMPDISIASDFIIGFPTETEEEFAATADLIRYCRFKNSFIFKYSPRPGTTAIDRFVDDIPEEVKRRRNNELLAVQSEVTLEGHRQMVGGRFDVMVEGVSKMVARRTARAESTRGLLTGSQSSGPFVQIGRSVQSVAPSTVATTVLVDNPARSVTQLVGRTRGDAIIVFDGPMSLKGKIIDVEVTSAERMTLFGRRVGSVTAD